MANVSAVVSFVFSPRKKMAIKSAEAARSSEAKISHAALCSAQGADLSARAAELRRKLAVLDHADPPPPDAVVALNELADLAGASDAAVVKGRAKLAKVDAAKQSLADLTTVVDQDAAPTAGQAATYAALVAEITRGMEAALQ